MSNMEFQFEEIDPEYEDAIVPSPQVVVLTCSTNTTIVIVYFMANAALQITEGVVSSGMGKVNLQYKAVSPSGAALASVRLHKVKFTFPNSQGMARNFIFNGQKT